MLVFLTYMNHDAEFRECKDQHTEFVNFTQKISRYFYKSFKSYFAIAYILKSYKLFFLLLYRAFWSTFFSPTNALFY